MTRFRAVSPRVSIHAMLSEGRHRLSIARSSDALAYLEAHPEKLNALMECLWDEDAGVANRAADVLQKFSRRRPEVLMRWKAELLGLMAEVAENKVRWNLARVVPRLRLTAGERRRVVDVLLGWMDDPSSCVRTWALNGVAELAMQEESGKMDTLRADAIDLLRIHSRSGTPAMRARCRLMLKKLERGTRRGAVALID